MRPSRSRRREVHFFGSHWPAWYAMSRIADIALSRSLELRVQLEAHRQGSGPKDREPSREPAGDRVHHAVGERDAVREAPDDPQAGHGPERLEFR